MTRLEEPWKVGSSNPYPLSHYLKVRTKRREVPASGVVPPSRGERESEADLGSFQPSKVTDPVLDWRRGDPAEHIAAPDLTAAELLAARLRRLREPWFDHAECAKHPGVKFFLGRGDDPCPALELCRACEVRGACRSWAFAADPPLDGCIVGGMTAAEYKRARPRRRAPKNKGGGR